MKLYMAEGAYGGFKWWTSYFHVRQLTTSPRSRANGDVTDKASQTAGNTYFGSRNWGGPARLKPPSPT